MFNKEKENKGLDKMLFNTFNLGELETMDPSLSKIKRRQFSNDIS